MVTKYSFLTPRAPNKTLGGLISPGTLTRPHAREREARERESERETEVEQLLCKIV